LSLDVTEDVGEEKGSLKGQKGGKMDRHRLKQLRDRVGELHRFGSPSSMREASDIMRDEFDSVLSFALEATKPEPKPKHTIADNYPAGGLTATEPCMYCEDYGKIEQQRDDLLAACKGLMKAWITAEKRSMHQLKTDMDNAYKIAEAAKAKYEDTPGETS